ncbi:hypothetical protein ZIOFF_005713 [Zingiber officinale]|uniref:Uncharacterized protein n=1 Tax=Zingiber officinale TaxID=94328 RepID=A0A8J5HR81_ZINOF|nr:hypothetical protein ZIOFF_005713 [Zingiber officinale]
MFSFTNGSDQSLAERQRLLETSQTTTGCSPAHLRSFAAILLPWLSSADPHRPCASPVPLSFNLTIERISPASDPSITSTAAPPVLRVGGFPTLCIGSVVVVLKVLWCSESLEIWVRFTCLGFRFAERHGRRKQRLGFSALGRRSARVGQCGTKGIVAQRAHVGRLVDDRRKNKKEWLAAGARALFGGVADDGASARRSAVVARSLDEMEEQGGAVGWRRLNREDG